MIMKENPSFRGGWESSFHPSYFGDWKTPKGIYLVDVKPKSQRSYDLVAFSSACRVIFQFLHILLSLTPAFLWLSAVLAPQSDSTLPTMQTQETEAVALLPSACYYSPKTGLLFRATQTNCWLLSIPGKNGKSDLSQEPGLRKRRSN